MGAGTSDKGKASETLYAALNPIVTGWRKTTKKYQGYAYILFLACLGLTVFLSVFSPYKFFPTRPDLLHLRTDIIDKAIHNYKPIVHHVITPAKKLATKQDFKRKNAFGFTGKWRIRPEDVKK